jgi:hypothetical protein
MNIEQLASDWLELPSMAARHAAPNSYNFIFPDRRGRITELHAEHDDLTIVVSSALRRPQLTCGVSWIDFQNQRTNIVARVRRGAAFVHFGRSVKSFSVVVFNKAGAALDSYSEGSGYVSWGPSLYNQARAGFDAPYAALQAALQEGESDHVEFKRWVRLDETSDKIGELITTTCAFANARGGEIFVGISDDATIYDLRKDLRQLYTVNKHARLAPHLDKYIRDATKLLTEGVHPSPKLTMGWIDMAGRKILRIEIARGEDGPYRLAPYGDYYLRRGATNRRATPDEVGLVRAASA